MLTKKNSQTIQLVNENCHPNEAWKTLNELIGECSRQHDIKMLRNWEGNHNFDSRPFDIKISEMKARCREMKTLIEEAKRLGYNIEIKANIELRMARKPLNNTAILNNNHN